MSLPLQNGSFDCLKRIKYTQGTANGSAVTASSKAGAVQEVTLTLNALSIATTDNGANGGQGGVKIYDFQEGNIAILGVSHNLTLTKVGAGIAATSTVLSSLGTALVAQNEATLTGTEADIVASNSTVLAAGTGVSKARSSSYVTFDGTTTAKDLYLNLNVDATGSTANDAILVSGNITIAYCTYGDY